MLNFRYSGGRPPDNRTPALKRPIAAATIAACPSTNRSRQTNVLTAAITTTTANISGVPLIVANYFYPKTAK
jgi:hypothetical protein